jgi:hypothetical protein
MWPKHSCHVEKIMQEKLPLRCQESKVYQCHCCTLAFSRVGASGGAMKAYRSENIFWNVCYVLFSISHNICGELTTKFLGGHHGLINYIDTKAKCRYLKKWSVKGLCGRCLSEFIDWRYSQSCWYFRPSFVNCCPSPLLSGSFNTSPLSPFSM